MSVENRNPVEALRSDIRAGRYLPNERLVETELAATYKTNRAHVRNALARLEQEGLIIRQANRGARVRLIGREEALEILEVRSALETLITRQAAEHATPEQCDHLRDILVRMRNAYDEGALAVFSDLNGDFHAYIRAISGNRTAEKILDELSTQIVRLQYRSIFIPRRAEQSMLEHEEIFEAIAEGDGAKAEETMRRHIHHVTAALRHAIEIGHPGDF